MATTSGSPSRLDRVLQILEEVRDQQGDINLEGVGFLRSSESQIVQVSA